MTPTKTQPPTVRRHEPGDRRAIRNLHDDAPQAGGEFLVGILEERTVAMGALRRAADGRAWITRMRASPGFQGRGIGQTLIDAPHGRAAGLGYGTLHLDTAAGQVAAQRPHGKNGYRETGRGRVGPFERLYYERESGA